MLKKIKKIDFIETEALKNYSATEKLKNLLMLNKNFRESLVKLNSFQKKEKKSFNTLKKIFLFIKIDVFAALSICFLMLLAMNLMVLSDEKDDIESKFKKINVSEIEAKDKIFKQFVNNELSGQELTLTEKYNLFEIFLLNNTLTDVSKKINTFELGDKNSKLGLYMLMFTYKNENLKDSLIFNEKIFLFVLLVILNYMYFLPLLSNLLNYKKVKKESELRQLEMSELSKNINYFEVTYIKEWENLNISEEKITFKDFYEKYYINENSDKLEKTLINYAIMKHVPNKVIYKNMIKNELINLDINLNEIEENIKENLSLISK